MSPFIFFFLPYLAVASILPAVPRLVPVFTMTLQLQGAPQSLSTDNTTGITSILGVVATGNATTIENDLGVKVELQNLTGYDHFLSHGDKKFGQVNVKLHGTTPEGVDVSIAYSGIISCPAGINALFSGAVTSPADYYFSTSPQISVSGPVPESLKWIEKENFVTNGVFLAQDGTMFVQYTVYVVR